MRGAEIQRALRERPLTLVMVVVLVVLYGGMISAEVVSPYLPTTVFRQSSYHPPNLRLWSRELGVRPQLQRHTLVDELTWRYAPLRESYVPVRLFVPGPSYRMWGAWEWDIHLFGTLTPYGGTRELSRGAMRELWGRGERGEPIYLFGADQFGRDLFSRIAYGSRVSLTIGLVGITLSLSIAILFGGIAGYFGGAIDWIVMRVAEFVILIPGLYLILFLRSVFSRNMDSAQTFLLITAILSLVGWPGSARLIRGMVHTIKREEFVLNAQLEGIPVVVIIFRHIMPQISSILIVSVTLGIPSFILGETVLSYLGLGIIEPAVSWGSLLNREITTLTNLRNYPWFLSPGLFLLLATLGFNFLGDLLRDILDPYFRSKGGGV